MNILMIDDDPAMLSAMETALNDFCEPVLADTGRRGIAAFARRRPNVVILDMRLPDLEGLEVLSTLKSIDTSVPVVVLSAIDDTATASQALKAGAFTYLTKPVELRSLLSTIQQATNDDYIANGIVLPSVITKNLFQNMTLDYVKRDTLVLIGEKGVGKKSFARSLHLRFHGSDHSFLSINAGSLSELKSLSRMAEGILTLCVNYSSEISSDVQFNPDWSRFFRKIILAVEIPSFDRSFELKVENQLSEKWKTYVIPPLRLRKSEAFPLLCYWHQKMAPEKKLDQSIGREGISELDSNGFPGNVKSIVELAREISIC